MKLPHDGIDVTFFCRAIEALEKVYGPKMMAAGSRLFVLLAEVQHEYKQLPDPARKPKKKRGK